MNQELLNRILQSPRLPSLPTIAIEVIDLVQQKDVNIKQIANTISHDPALTSKILKTVNSSFYGQAHSISTISHALVVLGLNSVKTLALGFSLVGNLKESGGEEFNHFAFWKRSLYTAAAARALAKRAGLPQQEEVFLGGLLQDLGMLAMNQALGADYRQLCASAGTDHGKLRELEQKKYEMDHAAIGGALGDKWNLPPLLVAPIRFHHDPTAGPEELLPIMQCVALGNFVADVFMSDTPGDALEAYYRNAQEWFQIPHEAAEPLLTEIHKDTVEMRRLFDLPTGPLENPDEILARANEALLNISMQQQHEKTQLQQQNEQLIEQANTDGLTGAANRRRFNEFIEEQFQATAKSSKPLSLLFMDADHFKKFNDTYGHQTGDRVLVELAAALKKHVPAPGLVARYGGEEFSVVLPNTDRLAAARIAEEIRQKIAAIPIQSDAGEKLSITASIGVSTFDGNYFERVEQFIKAADQGVYAAKASGRNCVRVFTPRPKTKSA